MATTSGCPKKAVGETLADGSVRQELNLARFLRREWCSLYSSTTVSSFCQSKGDWNPLKTLPCTLLLWLLSPSSVTADGGCGDVDSSRNGPTLMLSRFFACFATNASVARILKFDNEILRNRYFLLLSAFFSFLFCSCFASPYPST